MRGEHDVCIVGLKCYDLLTGAAVPRFLGGIEKQLVSLADVFVGAGLKVAFVVYDHGQPAVEHARGMTVIKSFDPAAGWPGVRFVHPRATGLWRAMHRARARVCLQMGAGVETGWVSLGCRDGHRFVYLAASDSDCQEELPRLAYGRERILYRTGLGRADVVVAQTEGQRGMLREGFGLEAVVVPIPCAWATPDDRYTPPLFPAQGEVRVLWVGRIVEVKRLEWLLDLAERCPGVWFDVVGTPNSTSRYYHDLVGRAESTPNVTMHGKVSSAELQQLYERAALLCCTSVLEGFPTTFLEAWNYGKPVLTTFDPDGVVAANRVGIVADTLDGLEAGLRRFVSSAEAWTEASRRSRAYFVANYMADALLPRYLEILGVERGTAA